MMAKDPENDPITAPEDSYSKRQQKRRGGRGLVSFFIIYTLAAFGLYLVIVLFGVIRSS
ncbi:hypothetical protein [Rhizobium oryzicola]|uniref:Uncharacterized protein n=1 Tax=Rhizobium oryzicola TaxID=1232668 RepID=A0ABT8T0B7_9HYPH|nr:hypothetical protein [Rhizobium oryzicola]MDO1584184.1 hypothetical protein [Rhizobium oryzicola]